MKNILITGGLGYIGSHTAVELLAAGHNVIIVDNLCNTKLKILGNIEAILGLRKNSDSLGFDSGEEKVVLSERGEAVASLKEEKLVFTGRAEPEGWKVLRKPSKSGKKPKFYQIDVNDTETLTEILANENVDGVIHFAALKSVGQSILQPTQYYRNNVGGLLSLISAAEQAGVRNLIFSSSATVYGAENPSPVSEDAPIGKALNPYGQTKIMGEQILTDLSLSDQTWNITLLRYFNPVGSHQSGLLGDDPSLPPTNLMPILMRAASGELPEVQIFGDDYPTKDGTAVRDYIHVTDLARGHIAALNNPKAGIKIYNLGTGNGYSVKEMVETFESVNNLKLKVKMAPRRDGDLAVSYSNPKKAWEELGWKANLSLDEMCKSAWEFYRKS